MSVYHRLDPYPILKEELPLYVNEPWLIDRSLLEYPMNREPDGEKDNVRIYIPMDLNGDAILRRLDRVIAQYGAATWKNEMEYGIDVGMIIEQLEIYDQIWYVRHMPPSGDHSLEAISLVKEIVSRMEEIPDGGTECFPFDTIARLKQEYLLE